MHCGRASCVRIRHIGAPTAAQRQHWHGGGLNGQRHPGESVSESVSRVAQCSTATLVPMRSEAFKRSCV